MKRLLLVALFLVLCGCATTGKLNKISLGMSKAEAIEVMGKPVSTSAIKGTEYLNYTLTDPVYYMPEPYYICIQDGKVTSFGRQGDFDTTKDPTQVIKVIGDVKTDETIKTRSLNEDSLADKLKTLNKLLTDRLITQNEFDEQKKRMLNDYISN